VTHGTIARTWQGRTTKARADEYEAYLLEAGYPPLLEHALGADMTREDREADVVFTTTSYLASIDDMVAFAGANPTAVHHLERDREFLIELPRSVRIARIVRGDWPVRAG
jgi:hypothetical protein